MGLKEDLIEMKKEIKDVKEQSLAWELLKDSKQANKRICIAFTIVISLITILWASTIIYLIYILNDIGVEEITEETSTTQEVHDIDNIDNSYIINGDKYGDN